MTAQKHTAKRLTNPGGIPVYEFRGHRIVRDSLGWWYHTDRERHATTLETAKYFIGYFVDHEQESNK